MRQEDGTFTEPELIRTNPFAQSRTFGPGALLIMVGLLSGFMNATNIASNLADPEGFAARTREDFARMAEQGNAPQVIEYGELTIRWMPVVRFVFLGMSLMTLAGGFAMIRKRYHSLAMLGAVASLFNVANCCCVMGFPAGAWALYVLMNPEVRAGFYPRPTSQTPAPDSPTPGP